MVSRGVRREWQPVTESAVLVSGEPAFSQGLGVGGLVIYQHYIIGLRTFCISSMLSVPCSKG